MHTHMPHTESGIGSLYYKHLKFGRFCLPRGTSTLAPPVTEDVPVFSNGGATSHYGGPHCASPLAEQSRTQHKDEAGTHPRQGQGLSCKSPSWGPNLLSRH